MEKPVTPWRTSDEIVVFAIAGIIGAVIGANLMRFYRRGKAQVI